MIVLRSKFSLSSQHFLLLVSAVYTFGFNFPFLSHAYQGAFATPNTSLTFVLALPALLFALQYLFFSLLLWPRVHKVFLIIVTLLSLGVRARRVRSRV
jgi:glucan phosphoethanolaminetransferase (alkaline phosphatase superfamily)